MTDDKKTAKFAEKLEQELGFTFEDTDVSWDSFKVRRFAIVVSTELQAYKVAFHYRHFKNIQIKNAAYDTSKWLVMASQIDY